MAKPAKKAEPSWGVHVFLNPPASADRGWLRGRVVHEDWTEIPQIELDVADCSRIITLDFTPDNLSKRSKAARIRKLRRLQKTVNTFVERAIAAIESAEPRPKEAARAQEGTAL